MMVKGHEETRVKGGGVYMIQFLKKGLVLAFCPSILGMSSRPWHLPFYECRWAGGST